MCDMTMSCNPKEMDIVPLDHPSTTRNNKTLIAKALSNTILRKLGLPILSETEEMFRTPVDSLRVGNEEEQLLHLYKLYKTAKE